MTLRLQAAAKLANVARHGSAKVRRTMTSGKRSWGGVAAMAIMAASLATAGACAAELTTPSRAAPLQTAPAITASIVFEPFAGVPGNTGDDILDRFVAEASRAGITVVPRVDMPATYRVVGRLSAVATDTSSVIFYDLRLVDAQGREVHRIVGQETGYGTRGDPWASIDSNTIAFLAQRAVVQIRAFLTRG